MLKNYTIFVAFFVLLLTHKAYSRISDFETTRLKASGGAGVGAVLMEEATLLNPAPMAFFNGISTFYFQKVGSDSQPNSSSDPTATNRKSEDLAAIASDAKARSAASASYVKHTEDGVERKQIAGGFAYRAGPVSSFGVSYKMTEDQFLTDATTKKTKQVTFGASHILSDALSIGFVVVDPFQEIPRDTKGIMGIQYTYKNFISLFGDVGSNYNNELSTSLLYRGGIQFGLFGALFLRVGAYRDRSIREKGNGIGLSWIQPKLMLDFAIKNYEQVAFAEIGNSDRKAKESSISLSFRF